MYFGVASGADWLFSEDLTVRGAQHLNLLHPSCSTLQTSRVCALLTSLTSLLLVQLFKISKLHKEAGFYIFLLVVSI